MSLCLYPVNQLKITHQTVILQYKKLTFHDALFNRKDTYMGKTSIKMGSDIYHLILQTLVYNLHLSRLHSVRSSTPAKKKKESSLYLLYFQQVLYVLKLSYHRSLRLCLVSKDVATSISVKGMKMTSEAKEAQTGKKEVGDSLTLYYAGQHS